MGAKKVSQIAETVAAMKAMKAMKATKAKKRFQNRRDGGRNESYEGYEGCEGLAGVRCTASACAELAALTKGKLLRSWSFMVQQGLFVHSLCVGHQTCIFWKRT